MPRRIGVRVHVALAIALSLPVGSAHAAGPRASQRTAAIPAPRLPAPFVLPELAHGRLDANVDWFVGRVAPEHNDRPGAVAAIVRPSVEMPFLLPRRLFLGLSYPIASALPPDGGLAPGEAARPSGSRTILGNAEAHIRAVFPLPDQLEIGFTLGLVAPTSAFNRNQRANRSAVDAVSSLDPTNYVHFLPERLGLRPAGDLRIVRGPLVVQGRHGIDILIDNEGIDQAKVAGRLLGHVGFLVRPTFEVSVEATQIYFFASDDQVTGTPSPEKAFADRYRISDGRRTALTVGPAMRVALPDFDIGAALVTNLNDPLSPASAGFFALRISVMAHLGSGPGSTSGPGSAPR